MSEREPLRVVQWTTGNIARQTVRAVLARDDLELVGVFAYSADKVGVDDDVDVVHPLNRRTPERRGRMFGDIGSGGARRCPRTPNRRRGTRSGRRACRRG